MAPASPGRHQSRTRSRWVIGPLALNPQDEVPPAHDGVLLPLSPPGSQRSQLTAAAGRLQRLSQEQITLTPGDRAGTVAEAAARHDTAIQPPSTTAGELALGRLWGRRVGGAGHKGALLCGAGGAPSPAPRHPHKAGCLRGGVPPRVSGSSTRSQQPPPPLQALLGKQAPQPPFQSTPSSGPRKRGGRRSPGEASTRGAARGSGP